MKKISLFILMVLKGVCIYADSTHESAPSLKQILISVEKNNPALQAGLDRWRAAQAAVPSVLALPKLRVDFERMYSGAEKNIAVSQEIPYPLMLIQERSMAKTKSAMAKAEFDRDRLMVLSEAKRAYAMWCLNHHHGLTYQETVSLMKRMAVLVESKYATNQATQGEVLKVQVELAKMLSMSKAMAVETKLAQAELNRLMNQPLDTFLGIPDEIRVSTLTWTDPALIQAALLRQPELAEKKLEVKEAKQAHQLARSSYGPDFMLQVRRRTMEMEPDTNDTMVGVSVPLWFWTQQKSISRFSKERDAAAASLSSAQAQTVFNVSALSAKWVVAKELEDLYRVTVLPQARQMLNVTQNGYQSGRTAFLDVLDAHRTLLDLTLEYHERLAETAFLQADLEREIGVDSLEDLNYEK